MLELDDGGFMRVSEEFHVPIVDAVFDRAVSVLPANSSPPDVAVLIKSSHLAHFHQGLRFSVHLTFSPNDRSRPQ